MKLNRLVASAALGLCALSSHAAVFTDDFNGDALALNQTSFLGGWAVNDGTVDVIGSGFFDFIPANVRYVDLDGSSSNAGLFGKTLTLTAGVAYIASFDLAGSQRGSDEIVNVSFGDILGSYDLASADGFGTSTLSFTPTTTGDYLLSFQNLGGDNVGALLDNVSVTAVTAAVPEPETYALMLLGLAAVGGVVKRRRSA